MNFGGAIGYVLQSIGKIPMLSSGLAYFFGGGIGKSFALLKQSASRLDMRNGRDSIYTGWGLSFWNSLIFGIISLIITSLSFGLWGILTGLLGGIGQIIVFAVSILIYALFISLGSKNETHWSTTLVKVLTVLYLIGCVLNCVTAVKAVIAIIKGFSAFSILTLLSSIVSVLTAIVGVLCVGMILDGFNKAVPSNNYNMNNGYNMNNSYNPNQQNGFDTMGAAGLGAINTVKNQSVGQDTTGFNSTNQGNNFNSNNGYNQQNDFNANMNNGYSQQNMNQNNQNVQMYACPYCGGAITYGTNPCPHCRSQLNWG